MQITICNQIFETETIKNIDIAEGRVFIDTDDDYYSLRWTRPEDIREAENYLNFTKLTRRELLDAVNIIILVCDYFINRKEQCNSCPLKKKQGCIFDYTPIDWRD